MESMVFNETYDMVNDIMDPQEFRKILQMFKSELAEMLLKLTNHTATKKEIHKLKSSANSLGAYKVANACDITTVTECLDDLNKKLE